LFAESVDVELIADKIGTPVYIYSKATFLDHIKKIQTAYAGIDTTMQ
jgi:diaminopimelate decarboxylase